MEDGTKVFEHKEEKKIKVKKFFYKLTVESGGEEEIPIVMNGSFNKNGELSGHAEGFSAKNDSFASMEPTITVTSARTERPALWLLIGFMTSVNLSPDDIKCHVSPPSFHAASFINP